MDLIFIFWVLSMLAGMFGARNEDMQLKYRRFLWTCIMSGAKNTAGVRTNDQQVLKNHVWTR